MLDTLFLSLGSFWISNAMFFFLQKNIAVGVTWEKLADVLKSEERTEHQRNL